MSRARLAALAAALAVLASACQLRVDVGVDVHGDGSGLVRVAVGLDRDAVRRLPDLASRLKVDDLRDAGWEITGPTEELDGITWIRASKPFSSPDDAGAVLEEISGADGPFRDFRVGRSTSLWRDRFRFDGTVDLTSPVRSFVDDQLEGQLGDRPLDPALEDLGVRLDRITDEVFQVRVAVRLPGSVSGNAPTLTSNGALWRPELGEEATLEARSAELRVGTLVLLGIGTLAAVAFVVLVVVRATRWRRARTLATPDAGGGGRSG